MSVASHIKKDLLLYLTMLAVLLGTIVGVILRYVEMTPYQVYLLKFPGELMLRILKMLILPLITCSLITGVTGLNSEASGKMGVWALIYYFSTTILAAILGITIVFVIRPGDPDALPTTFGSKKIPELQGNTLDAIFDLLRNMFPDNLVQATFQLAKTKFDDEGDRVGLEYSNGMNVLGLITFCICFGVCMTKLKKQSQPLIELIRTLNEIIMKLVLFFMWYSPIGIFFLIASNIVGITDMTTAVKTLGMFVFTTLFGLFFHFFVTLYLIYFLTTRKNPLKFTYNMLPAMMTAFGTASSTATLPLTFKCLEERNKIDKRVTRFVLPIGATVNMDGTALYEGLTALFIAQLNRIPMGPGKVITICITSIAASVGAASIPSAGLVTMILVFTAVGLPTEQISMIYTVDWLLDRFRTTINIMGDSFGAAIVEHINRDELDKLGELEDETSEDNELPKEVQDSKL